MQAARRACLGALLTVLVAACGPRADPQFYLVLDKSRAASIEGQIESERARSEMNVAIANALTEAGWGGQARLTVADVRRMEWESHIGEVLHAVASLTSGRLAVAAGSVEVAGEAPSETIDAIQPALEKIFGSRYLVRVDVRAPALASALAPLPPVPTSGTIAYKWSVVVYGHTDVAPIVWLPEEEAGTFDVEGVLCHISATQRSKRHDGDIEYQQIHRDLSCDGATIESLARFGPFIPHGVGCEYRADTPFVERARHECADQFAVQRTDDKEWHRNLLLEVRPVVR
jgi:hypothetical protein